MTSEGIAGMDKLAEDILEFWSSAGAESWYLQSAELDGQIRERYEAAWSDALAGKYSHWQLEARSALALVILLDQFPRNMFRNNKNSFASDRMARCVANKAIGRNFDQQIEGAMRQFFYLPFMHSESVTDQDTAVRAFLTRMPEANNLLHARVHRQVIRDFGRFPYRNEALGRESTEKELAYLDAGGYGFTFQNIDK